MPDGLIEIEGLEDVQRLLAEAPRTVVARGYLKALQAGANVIANELESNTPIKKEDVGGLLDKGVLRESVMIVIELDSDFRGGVALIGFGKNGFVALWLEYGHRMLSHGAKGTRHEIGTGIVAANPFMRRTTAACADRAIDAFADALASELKGGLFENVA